MISTTPKGYCHNQTCSSEAIYGAKLKHERIDFLGEEAPEGGFNARALGESIFTQADTEIELHAMI
jgi:hypothetical protein